MSGTDTLSIFLPSEQDTARFGEWLAMRLRPGDTLLLEGQIGAGKTHLARALIRARLGRMEDVPSPTFTLVQTYDAGKTEIRHADLYRLGHPDEVMELGLQAAFDTAICLIEWPDRLGSLAPPDAMYLRLSQDGDGRRLLVCGGRADLRNAMAQDWVIPPDRTALGREFLDRAGWGDADRRFLAGDASDRSYDRLARGAETAVLMDAPPGKGDDPATFVTIARHLTGLGLSAPQVLAADLTRGFLLLEDLGDGLFARLTARDPDREPELYAAATDVLVHLQRHAAPPGLPDPTAQDWAQAAAFALDWYRFAITGNRVDTADFVKNLTEVLTTHADGPRVMIVRDYHAENLLWLPDRTGLAKVGLLDFQLAQMGQPGYDLVSLLQDARRDVTQATEAAMIARFVAATGADEVGFSAAYATLGAQRALRILGIFARLCLRDGKRQYLALIPRVWSQLQRNLAHPALAPLALICQDVLPAPTPERLERIAAACAKPPTP